MQLRLLFLITIMTSGVVAQESDAQLQNSKRIDEIAEAIKQAVNNENYETAANLQKEDFIRQKMVIAYENKNNSRVEELKEELDNCNCVEGKMKNQNNSNENQFKGVLTPEQKQNKYRSKRFVKYFNFSPFAYIQSKTTYFKHNWHIGYPNKTKALRRLSLIGGGFRIGGTIFFDDMKEHQKLRVGLDILFVSFTAGLNMNGANNGGTVYFGLGQPGMMFKYYLNKNSGFNFRLNLGSNFAFSNIQSMAFGFQGRLSYWLKNFSIGIEYQFLNSIGLHITPPDGSIRINQIGLNCGFHF